MRPDMTCKKCGSLLSCVTWECVRGRYCAEAVDKAIAASNRSGRRIGGREAKAIHSLLRGRHGGPVVEPEPK
jgi:hypothetical protein